MNQIQAQAYLDRIGCSFTAPDAKNLAALQYRHLLTVPYENLDILEGIRISLCEEALFDKIVTRHRGGYCFEVNRLFGALLRALGYEVYDLSARYLRGVEGIPMRRHHVLRVTCADGSTYLCDVGVGEPLPMEPVPYLTTEVFRDSVGGEYFFREDAFLGHVLCENHKGAVRDVISFTEEPWIQEDYETISFYCEFAPDSIFNKGRICAIRREGGYRITLSGNIMHTFINGTVEETEIPESQIPEILDTVFGIR